ncbi:Cna B-type domain-containing protein [Olsenella uli]|uniref:Cna B-type domain-containing protein n=2 Tax=Coriobacteriia TaxID=84998 RepID=UPI0024A92CC7|nr:Cna B-type domain-containing protein [Olsenella uli]
MLLKRLRYLLAVALAVGIVVGGGGHAFADGGVPVNVTITKFQILNINKEEVHKLHQSDRFYLAMDWDASAAGTNIHEGDYFDITLPDNMKFPAGTTAQDFDLEDADGNAIAKAHVTPGSGDVGGTVRVTFTKAAENKYNVKGTMYLAAQFDETKIIKDAENVFTITVNSQAFSSSVTVASPGLAHNESLAKWGKPVPGHEDQAEWNVRINHKKANLPNAVISDSLSGGNGDERYIADSFKLLEVEFNEYGGIAQEIQTIDLTDKLQIAPDGRSFTINLGNVNGKQYRLYYKSTYHAGTVLKNKATLDASSSHSEASYSYQSAESGGTAGGDLASKIKLTKVDADDNAVVLKNAVFTVAAPDGSTFELTTGADGTVTSGVLTQGTYKVKEKTPPDGYELNGNEYTLEVTPTGGALKTICDRPIKTSASVTKRWVGPEGGEVTAHLLADGVDTGKELKLNAGNNWTGSFDNLRKYKAGTATEIVYTVKEDPVANYDSDVVGSMSSGFTITNTNTETVEVSGAKSWDDDNDRDGVRPASITVNLMRDGAKADSKTVTPDPAGTWAYSFTGLPKYDPADGHEYAYAVTEEAVPNYATEVNDTDIVNSHTPGKTSVTVTKAWADANNRDGIRPASVKAQLYANSKPLGEPVELSDANGWTHTWTGLFMKEAGKDVAYEVKEVSVPKGYEASVAGDAKAGYTLTNAHEPETVSIPVVKKWVGGEGGEVTIHLLADGHDTGKSLKLNAGSGWKGSFDGLPAFEGGERIAYTVSEDAVEGYSSKIEGDASKGFTVTNARGDKPKAATRLPQTGDAAGAPALAVLAASGLAVAAGALLRRREG